MAQIAFTRRALEDWVVLGVETNLRLLQAVLSSEEFASGGYATDLVSRLPAHDSAETSDAAWIAAALEFSRTGTGAGGGAVSPGEPWDAGTGWRVGA